MKMTFIYKNTKILENERVFILSLANDACIVTWRYSSIVFYIHKVVLQIADTIKM